MKPLVLGTLLAALVSNQAQALSCARPDVTQAFQSAADADESYVVLFGEFTFDAVPQVDNRNPPSASTVIDALFSGQVLGAGGFQDTAPMDVTLMFNCYGPWCGSIPPEAGDIIAFVEQTSNGHVLRVDPCYSNVFTRPAPAELDQIEDCMRGEACAPSIRR